VLLDSDVAMLYGYETKQVNQTASRNIERFPESFRFQLTKEEIEAISSLRRQNGTLKRGQHRKYHQLFKTMNFRGRQRVLLKRHLVDCSIINPIYNIIAI